MTNIVYVNGDFVAKNKAKISVLDRGFLFGDGIYEVIPVYQGKLFRVEHHLKRLQYCLDAISLANPYSVSQWQTLFEQIINKNGGGNLSLYLQVTRGIQPERNHLMSGEDKPSVVIMVSELTAQVAELASCKAALLEDFRWQHCDIKSTSLLGNILLRQQAEQLGASEAILHRNNYITEGATSNVFIAKDGEIYTPAKGKLLLTGITRDLIIELAENVAIKVHQKAISLSELVNADEVWISSSSREISPVTQIDGKIIGTGEIGPIATRIHSEFQQFKAAMTCSK